MGFSVNTNLDALNTYRNLQNTQNSLSSSLAKLSSGLRINNAGDDAAGLTIATALGSQVSGLTVASRNAQDGTSVVQTADGALSQAQSLLGRLRDLAVQAANDSNSSSARTAIQTEATSISSELNRMGTSTTFNGISLLNQSAGQALTFQVGANAGGDNQISVDLSTANLTTIASALTSANVYTGSSYTITDPTKLAAAVDFSTTQNGTTSTFSATLKSTTIAGAVNELNANSGFSSQYTASVNYNGSGTATGFTVVAKNGAQVSMAAATATAITATEAKGTASTGIDLSSAATAQAALGVIDTQIASVSSARANIGALENRFASAVSTISTSITNLTAAKSRITDVDMASEMVNYSRANILSQSGTAMLAQANQAPQLALKLLG